jgi:membrane protein YqaA with SNARE-associated domain
MGSLEWGDVLALLTSIAFGAVSAVVPVVNAEAYVIASQVSAVVGPVPVAIGIGAGQTIGKLLLFLGVRRGKEFAVFKQHGKPKRPPRPAPVGSARHRGRMTLNRMLDLVGTKRWGLPIVALAAVIGLPPLYAVALLAGATKMRAGWFALVVLGGRVARFVLVALGVGVFHFGD